MLLISCNSSTVYSKLDKNFDKNRWMTSDIKTYDFKIEDDSIPYNLVFKFSHVYNYNFPSIVINYNIADESGVSNDYTAEIKIKDYSGKDLGDCAGDICDVSQIIQDKIKFKKGSYKVTIINNYFGEYLPNVLAVGLEVEKANEN